MLANAVSKLKIYAKQDFSNTQSAMKTGNKCLMHRLVLRFYIELFEIWSKSFSSDAAGHKV